MAGRCGPRLRGAPSARAGTATGQGHCGLAEQRCGSDSRGRAVVMARTGAAGFTGPGDPRRGSRSIYAQHAAVPCGPAPVASVGAAVVALTGTPRPTMRVVWLPDTGGPLVPRLHVGARLPDLPSSLQSGYAFTRSTRRDEQTTPSLGRTHVRTVRRISLFPDGHTPPFRGCPVRLSGALFAGE